MRCLLSLRVRERSVTWRLVFHCPQLDSGGGQTAPERSLSQERIAGHPGRYHRFIVPWSTTLLFACVWIVMLCSGVRVCLFTYIYIYVCVYLCSVSGIVCLWLRVGENIMLWVCSSGPRMVLLLTRVVGEYLGRYYGCQSGERMKCPLWWWWWWWWWCGAQVV